MKSFRAKLAPTILPAMLAAVLAAGCGGNGVTGLDVIPDIDKVDADDAVSDEGATQDNGSGPTDTGWHNNRPDYCPDWCPEGEFCEFSSRCLSDRTYLVGTYETDECGCQGWCNIEGPFECPADSFCYAGSSQGDGDGRPCHGDECNIEEGRYCGENQYCETMMGACGGRGACIYMGGAFIFGNGEEDSYYICGCDGITYAGTWERGLKGVSAKHPGQCCEADRIALSEANTEGCAVWTACAAPGSEDDLPLDIRELLESAQYSKAGFAMGCSEKDGIYKGSLELTTAGAVSPVQFSRLCRLASFPGFTQVTGRQENHCETDCYKGMTCTETDCPSICGCCACQVGQTVCTSEITMQECLAAGCWSSTSYCNRYSVCTTSKGVAGCTESCDRMLQYLKDWRREVVQTCDEDADCQAFAGYCDRADGPCWLAWNGKNTLSYYTMNSFQKHWLEAGCRDAGACGCGPVPAAVCNGGVCALVP